jgi:hypothetical protein
MINMVHQIKLKKNEFWKFSTSDHSNLRITAGHAWVTAKGCSEDFILEPGALLPLIRSEILVESLTQELVIEFEPAS